MQDNYIGKVIKDYHITEKIGEGSHATVYKAAHPKIAYPVVVKVLQTQLQEDDELIKRFRAEASVITKLNNHPNIIPIHDYWQSDDGAFIVLKWVDGGSLRDLLEEHGALTLNQTVYMLDRICSALAAAHEIDIIHRDIKPENILFDLSGNVYLSDFGVAKRPNSKLTAPGSVLGTPAYLSPEQILGEPLNYQADIYSMGILLFEALAGQRPFQGKMAGQVMMQHLSKPVPMLEYDDETLTGNINAIIQRATAKKAEERYKSALDMAADFRKAVVVPEE